MIERSAVMTTVNITLVDPERSLKKLNPQVDYLTTDKPFVIIRFIYECGKLFIQFFAVSKSLDIVFKLNINLKETRCACS